MDAGGAMRSNKNLFRLVFIGKKVKTLLHNAAVKILAKGVGKNASQQAVGAVYQ